MAVHMDAFDTPPLESSLLLGADDQLALAGTTSWIRHDPPYAIPIIYEIYL